VSFEPAPGIYGGAKNLEAYLAFMGVETLAELEQEQLTLDLGAAFTSSSTSAAKSSSTSCSSQPRKPAASGGR
jgi:hypothetical protein